MSPAELPVDLQGLAIAVALLGVRHGFDADHLAAIDCLTRANLRRPQLARRAGLFFALGHGAIVLTVAVAVSLAARAWQAPDWLESFGGWTSICILVLLAAANIRAVLVTPGHEATRLAGWRCALFERLLDARTPLAIGGIGSLFALSFDTLALAALFAFAGGADGWRSALVLASLFVAGMIVTDCINGRWIAGLFARADETARIASRTMALAVAGVGLLIASVGIAGRTVPAFESWSDGKELWFSGAIVAVIAASFVVGRWLARRSNAASTTMLRAEGFESRA